MKKRSFFTGLIASLMSFASVIGLVAFSFATNVAAAESEDFTDVPPSHPNYIAIMYLKEKGIVGGYADGTFKPSQVVNRAEALKMILGVEDMKVWKQSTSPLFNTVDEPITFTDIDRNAWYMPFLQKAVNDGLVGGYPDGTFKPAQTVNLAENLKILLYHTFIRVDLMSNVSVPPYADVPVDAWFAGHAQYAKQRGLIDADSSNMIYPAQGMTRGKLAEAIYRVMYVDDMGLDKFVASVDQTSGCYAEGESLGAVIPANAENKCCTGLSGYVPENFVGNMGVCVKDPWTAQSFDVGNHTVTLAALNSWDEDGGNLVNEMGVFHFSKDKSADFDSLPIMNELQVETYFGSTMDVVYYSAEDGADGVFAIVSDTNKEGDVFNFIYSTKQGVSVDDFYAILKTMRWEVKE